MTTGTQLSLLPPTCPRCGQNAHARVEDCQQISSIEYFESGKIKKIEYHLGEVVQPWPPYQPPPPSFPAPTYPTRWWTSSDSGNVEVEWTSE